MLVAVIMMCAVISISSVYNIAVDNHSVNVSDTRVEVFVHLKRDNSIKKCHFSDSSGFEVFVHSPVHAITGQTVQLYCNFSLPRGRILVVLCFLMFLFLCCCVVFLDEFVIDGGSSVKPSSCIPTSHC